MRNSVRRFMPLSADATEAFLTEARDIPFRGVHGPDGDTVITLSGPWPRKTAVSYDAIRGLRRLGVASEDDDTLTIVFDTQYATARYRIVGYQLDRDVYLMELVVGQSAFGHTAAKPGVSG